MPKKPSKGHKAIEPNLSRALLINLIAISITAILILGAVWIYSEFAGFRTSAGLMKERMVNEHKAMLRMEVESTVSYLRYMMAQAEQRLKESIKDRVYEAHTIATHLYSTHRDRLPEDRIKLLVKDALRPIRFNLGRGYYFATNMKGIEELFADRPELEGHDMLNLRGGQGEYVVRDMIALIREKEEGFYSYAWTKPSVSGNKHPKIAFVKYFEPFEWVIGTGEYLEDVVADIQKEVLARIDRIRFGQDGYIFAGTWQGDALSGPQKGQNMLHLMDENGVAIVEGLIDLAKSGGGFQTYVMPSFERPRSERDKPSSKLSYVIGIPEWQWYIGSGVHLDDVEAAIGKERSRMWTQIKTHILKIVVITVVLILFSVFLFYKMAHKTRRQFDAFGAAFAQAIASSEPIDEQKLQWQEFKRLAESANEMLVAREQARQLLIKNEAKYRKLFEQTNDAVFVVEKKSGRYLDANDAALKLVGYSLEELRELTTRDAAPKDFRQHLKQLTILESTLNFGELVYERPDGTQRIIDLTAIPLDDTAVYGIARDITERKQYIKELQETWAFLDAAIKQSPSGILIAEAPDFRIRMMNRAVFGLKEGDPELLTRDELLQHLNKWQICQPNGTPYDLNDLPLFKAISQGETTNDLELFLRNRTTGKERWVTSNAAPIKDADGVIRAAIVVFHDISERKRIETAIRLSEKRYRELADTLPQTVFETDEKGRLTFVNEVAFEIFGYSRDDFNQGLHAMELIAPEDHERAFENIIKVMNGQQRKSMEYMVQRKDGTTFPVVIHSNQIIIDGRIHGMRGIIVDLTEQKALEARLHQAQKMEAIGNLAGGIAHDFNNILSAVIGYTELALAEPPLQGQPAEGYLKGVLKAGKRAKSLVNQILTFARQIDEALKPVKVSIVAKEVLKLLRSSIPTTIKIETQISSNSQVMADLTQIHQIFMNLCTNAAQSMEKEGGTLRVTMDDIVISEKDTSPPANLNPGAYIRLVVQDTGEGIHAKHLKTIFDPYYTTKPIGRGTGLGLSVVHGIVENYGGGIVVESEPGHGSVFTTYLPILEQADDPPEESEKHLPEGNERILFIDDEQAIIEVANRFLKRLGYQVITQNSSTEALTLFQKTPLDFDLVITDMTMPDMNGDKLASELVKVRSDIPVIICTGYNKNLTEENLAQINVHAVVMKPMTFEDLALAVRKGLDEKRIAHKVNSSSKSDSSAAA